MDRSYYEKYEPIFGSWHIVREIGEGGFGKVFEIERKDFGNTYKSALKAITIPRSQSDVKSIMAEGMDEDSATEYFRSVVGDLTNEFALMSKLKGISNIVSYEDHRVIKHTDSIGWDILIRMELLTPLLDYTAANTFSCEDVINLGIDICKALEVCRKHKIIHRDIKPENIFISENGDYKLGDFGIARIAEKTTGNLSKKGTYTYMAPEVYNGKEYGPSVDIYSLGIVLYRYLNNNRAPFLPVYTKFISSSDMDLALTKRVNGEAMPAPVNASDELARIVLKACAYNASERYASPTEMRKDLEAAANAAAAKAAPEKEETHASDFIITENIDKTVGAFSYSYKSAAKNAAAKPASTATEPSQPQKIAVAESPTVKDTDAPDRQIPAVNKQEAVTFAAEDEKTLAELGSEEDDFEYNYFEESITPYEVVPAVAAKEEELPPVKTAAPPASNKKSKKKRNTTLADIVVIVATVICAVVFFVNPAWKNVEAISAGSYYSVGLKSDGTVVAVGDNYYGQCNVEDWTDIVAISAGYHHSVGLKSGGTVVAVGYNSDGRCDVEDWTDIVAISAGNHHSVGLKSDGTVVAVGDNEYGQCDVDDWTDIVAVSAGYYHTVGLKSDGTVVAVGANGYGRCDVEDWTDIIAISAGGDHTVGLKSDGTVVAVGDNSDGRCNVDKWTDIIAISVGMNHTVGLKSDGTVVTVGSDYYGQCDVDDWTDIVAISAGYYHTVGLKSDGTVVAVGYNGWGECDVR